MARVSLKKKKQLIDKIINGVRKYKFNIQRYGGETVLGTITPYQYHYWKDRQSELTNYLMGGDRETYEQENNLPQEAKFVGEWFENDNVAHMSGAPIESGNCLNIEEFDQHGEPIKDAKGHYVFRDPIELDVDSLNKWGITTVESGECVDVDHPNLINQYYLHAYTVNKGSFTTQEMIEIDGELDLKKLKLHFQQIEGSDICHAISYADGEPIYLEEDSTGKDQECRVLEGVMDEKTMSKKLKKEIARAQAEAPQPDTADDTEDGQLEDDHKILEKLKAQGNDTMSAQEWDEWEKARMEGAQAAKKKSKKKKTKGKKKSKVKKK